MDSRTEIVQTYGSVPILSECTTIKIIQNTVESQLTFFWYVINFSVNTEVFTPFRFKNYYSHILNVLSLYNNCIISKYKINFCRVFTKTFINVIFGASNHKKLSKKQLNSISTFNFELIMRGNIVSQNKRLKKQATPIKSLAHLVPLQSKTKHFLFTPQAKNCQNILL